MKYKEIINTVSISRDIINRYIKEGDIVLDATAGNGNDTLALASLVGPSGRVYGFDIQAIALKNTEELLSKNGLVDRVVLINDNHKNIDKYIKEKLDLVIYNLGYLPRGDKNIKTNPDSTIESLSKSLDLLKNNGLALIVSYIGHPGGLEEKLALEEFLMTLDQKNFNVLKSEFINQKNAPPLIYIIEKSI